ncbi:hypothetical protein LEP1GSC062_3752 [Leptospira alexanderi serovar Manhao 3 str. L 60]|uniref:Uncharacterized protein n=1 Tax=Leptospira alexanderi serovar Manhao 3 str. L 60 TaxID=1049759 RepID=V6I881_9LEPT|nr:hypothetical protein LEP1GSC062_3752 [Leptospira alexanderi serovar Manhao 3 str. L 60]
MISFEYIQSKQTVRLDTSDLRGHRIYLKISQNQRILEF